MLVSSTDISIFFKKITTWFTESQSYKRIYPIKTDCDSIFTPQILASEQDLLHYQSCVSRCSASLFWLTAAHTTVNTGEPAAAYSGLLLDVSVLENCSYQYWI